MNEHTYSLPRLALIGYGRMGRQIASYAAEVGREIAATFDRDALGSTPLLDSATLRDIDVCIEFTQPDAVLENIRACAEAGKNIVVGTTGWGHCFEEVQRLVDQHSVGLIYASNYSLGVQLFMRMVARAAEIMKPYPKYDVGITETHHRLKKDAPSGTALSLATILLHEMPGKKTIGTVSSDVAEDSDVMQISSMRIGSIPGIHTVLFDSEADSIELTHSAKSRAGFAEGALLAADWIHTRKGIFTIEDILNEIEAV